MKIALITDTHYGARKSSKLFHDYFQKFYDDIFFPTIKERKIKNVIHLGDSFDNRKSIDFYALDWAKQHVYDKFKKLKTKVYTIVGNHDVYYKNTNEVNAVDSLLASYNNIIRYSGPTEVDIDGFKTLLLPWICQDNHEESIKAIKNTKCKSAFGHLELNGFQLFPGMVQTNAHMNMDVSVFTKLDVVFSGHYHTRSNDGRVYYLGNPYEMFWNDCEDKRGFTIWDSDTLEHEEIDNPHRMFYKIYYNDTPYQTFNATELKGKIVKVIVDKKSKPKQFEKFIDKINQAGVEDLKVIENLDWNHGYIMGEDIDEKEENTISLLNRFVEESEIDLDKDRVKKLLGGLYSTACEVE